MTAGSHAHGKRGRGRYDKLSNTMMRVGVQTIKQVVALIVGEEEIFLCKSSLVIMFTAAPSLIMASIVTSLPL